MKISVTTASDQQYQATAQPFLDIKPQPLRTFTVPAAGAFMQVRRDFEMTDWHYKPRAFTLGWNKVNNPEGAYPDTVYLPGMKPTDFHPLSMSWQYLWLGLMRKACHNLIPDAELIKRWAIITRDGAALTDKHTWNWVKAGEPHLFADYVQGLNLFSGYGPMQQKSITMSGNIVKVVGSNGSNYVIETVDLTQPAPAVDQLWGQWWLVHWGTQSTILPYGASGKQWRVTDWSWLNWDGIGYGVPYLLIGRGGTNLIPKSWCKPIVNGAIYSPYLP